MPSLRGRLDGLEMIFARYVTERLSRALSTPCHSSGAASASATRR